MISFKDISFVVQGPVDKSVTPLTGRPLTQSALESLREHFPGAEIILSTWEGADLTGLDYDKVITSPDPGAVNFMLQEFGRVVYNNGNRQIVSTVAGLKAVTRPYAAKVRSDLLLQGNSWLAMWDSFPNRAAEWRIFRERLIIANLYARNPLRDVPKPFHPSDWLMFGLTEDLLLLWDIALEPEPAHSYWFRSRPQPACAKTSLDTRRYLAEQFLWKSLLERFGQISFDHFADATPENVRLTQLTFANNLILLDVGQFPLLLPKYGNPFRIWIYSCYSHNEWRRLYDRYCCGRTVASAIDRVLDARHWLETAYVMLPQFIRASGHRLLGGKGVVASAKAET